MLDEADEMLNMGFYKDVKQIIDTMKNRKSLSMFSATISREVLDIGWLYQHNAAEVSVQPVEDSSPKIAQYKLLTTGRDKLAPTPRRSSSAGVQAGDDLLQHQVQHRHAGQPAARLNPVTWTACTATCPRQRKPHYDAVQGR